MPFTDTPGERVARGLTVLTPACPLWWAPGPHAIDPDAIDFTSPGRGILALVYGSHAEGLRLLAVAPELAAEFGFAARDAADAVALAAAWRASLDYSRTENLSRPPR